MTKLYVLYRREYGDFDIAHDYPVAASTDRENLVVYGANLNKARTLRDIKAETGYWVGTDPEVILL